MKCILAAGIDDNRKSSLFIGFHINRHVESGQLGLRKRIYARKHIDGGSVAPVDKLDNSLTVDDAGVIVRQNEGDVRVFIDPKCSVDVWTGHAARDAKIAGDKQLP